MQMSYKPSANVNTVISSAVSKHEMLSSSLLIIFMISWMMQLWLRQCELQNTCSDLKVIKPNTEQDTCGEFVCV